MATFSGGTSPAALRALAPSINNLAAANRARSESISGLMRTIGVGLERKKKQNEIKEKNEIALGVAKELLNNDDFKKSVPGITNAADLIKLTSADDVIKFGREQQQAALQAKRSEAEIGLIQKEIDEFDRQKEERQKAEVSSKALQGLIPSAVSLKPGDSTKDIFDKIAGANLTPADFTTIVNTISNSTGLSSQVLMAELEKANLELGATKKSIESGGLASEIIAGIEAGIVQSAADIPFDRLQEMTPDAQAEVFSALKRKNPTAPIPIPISNPNNPEEILGYAIDTGNGNLRIMESPKSGDELAPGVRSAMTALDERLKKGEITPEAYQQGMATLRKQASSIQDSSGLLVDPAAPSDPPVTDPEAADVPAPTKNALDVAESLSNLKNIISPKGDLSMGELEKAISVYRSRNTGLSEDDFSQIKDILIQEAKDRREKERMKAEAKERYEAQEEIGGKTFITFGGQRFETGYGSK
jgi:hypothetical protein